MLSFDTGKEEPYDKSVETYLSTTCKLLLAVEENRDWPTYGRLMTEVVKMLMDMPENAKPTSNSSASDEPHVEPILDSPD